MRGLLGDENAAVVVSLSSSALLSSQELMADENSALQRLADAIASVDVEMEIFGETDFILHDDFEVSV